MLMTPEEARKLAETVIINAQWNITYSRIADVILTACAREAAALLAAEKVAKLARRFIDPSILTAEMENAMRDFEALNGFQFTSTPPLKEINDGQ